MNFHKTVCLQLTSTSIRAVYPRSDGKVISGEKALEIPEGAELYHHPALSQGIQSLLKELSLKPARALASISGNAVLLKRIQTPAFENANSAQLEQAMAHEIPNHISVPIDQAAYDTALMKQTRTANQFLLAWMRKKPLASLAEQLEDIGLTPLCVTPSLAALTNQLLFNEDCSQRICGVQVNGDDLDLVVIEDGQFMGGRSLSVGQIANSAALWRTLKQSLSAIPDGNQTGIQRVLVFQRDALFSAQEIETQLGVETCEIRPLADEWAMALQRSYTRREGLPLNLLKPLLDERADEKRRRQKERLKRLIPLVATLGLVAANVGLWRAAESTRSRIETLHGKLDAVQVKVRQTKNLRETQTALEKQIAELSWGERRFPSLSIRLQRIAEAIPGTVRLTEIKTLEPPRGAKERRTFDARETLLLTGLARSQEEIDAFRVALTTAAEFSSVRQIQTDQMTIKDQPWLTFTLALHSSGVDRAPVESP
jgi:hypothetical protein